MKTQSITDELSDVYKNDIPRFHTCVARRNCGHPTIRLGEENFATPKGATRAPTNPPHQQKESEETVPLTSAPKHLTSRKKRADILPNRSGKDKLTVGKVIVVWQRGFTARSLQNCRLVF